MNNKSRMVFLGAALSVTLVSGWGTVSASPIYENHFDVYRTITSAETVRDRTAKSRHTHLAKARPAASPVVLSDAPKDKSTPDTHIRSQ